MCSCFVSIKIIYNYTGHLIRAICITDNYILYVNTFMFTSIKYLLNLEGPTMLLFPPFSHNYY